jgi:cell fate (sporulation/competence/biofilm development) regulator YlbF (YheA/YmcA/DUF963 family)
MNPIVTIARRALAVCLGAGLLLPLTFIRTSALVREPDARELAVHHVANGGSPLPSETPTPTPEETPSPSPPDPELERLKREAALAEARKVIAQAEKDEAEARLEAAKARLGIGAATPAATPASGNITGDVTNFIETQLLAETGARMAGMSLFQQMCLINDKGQALSPSPAPVPALQDEPMKILIINSATDKAAIGKYRTILGQLQFLHDHYGELIKQSAEERKEAEKEFAAASLPLLVPAATSMVKNVAELVNLFRTETEFKNQTVAINTRLIVTHLANHLLTKKSSQCRVEAIYQPGVYPLSISADAKNGNLLLAYKQLLDDMINGDKEVNANNEKVTELRKDIATIDERIAELRKQIADYKKQQEDAEKAKTTKSKKKKKKKGGDEPPPEETFDVQAAEQEIDELNGKIARLQRAATSLQEFKASIADLIKLLTAVDDTTKQPVLNDLVGAGRLSDILSKDGAYALDLVVRASGTNRTRHNMFFNDKIDHSAGVSLDANLYDKDDRLVFGRLEDFYIEFTGSKDIRKRKGFQKLNDLPR